MQIRRAVFGFCLAVNLQWTLVSLHPLGLESRGVVGLHQRQPGYLPNYNGIFSLHALNFTAPTDAPHLQPFAANTSLSVADQEDGDDRLVPSDDQENKLLAEDGTAANEVDSEDGPKVPELTTFPQLHVVTQTIGDLPTEDWEQTAAKETETAAKETETAAKETETTAKETETAAKETETAAKETDTAAKETETAAKETETAAKETETAESTLDNDSQNETTTEHDHTGSETLLEGGTPDSEEEEEEDPSQDSEDIFDRLMRTIQGHWLDFVGKMKLSVLDVWKSISHHMMERLESFATGL